MTFLDAYIAGFLKAAADAGSATNAVPPFKELVIVPPKYVPPPPEQKREVLVPVDSQRKPAPQSCSTGRFCGAQQKPRSKPKLTLRGGPSIPSSRRLGGGSIRSFR